MSTHRYFQLAAFFEWIGGGARGLYCCCLFCLCWPPRGLFFGECLDSALKSTMLSFGVSEFMFSSIKLSGKAGLRLWGLGITTGL